MTAVDRPIPPPTPSPGARLTANGRASAVAALVAAGGAAWLTVASTTRFGEAASQFVSFALVIFVLAVVGGSRFAVGGAVLVGLAGAVIEIGTVSVQRWDRAVIIGSLWYLAAELAWDSVERRDGRRRSPGVEFERLQELATVLVVSLLAALVATALVDAAPPRTLAVLVLTVGGLACALIVATRHLATTGELEDEVQDIPG